MPHTPLVEMLRRAVSAAGEASIRGTETRRVLEKRALSKISRRKFISRASAAGLATLAGRSLLAKKGAGTPARVIVVGAGLAGLTCAYRLKQAGIIATIYEANSRVGGRCWTRREDFGEAQIAEHGGELIDQGHTHIRQLAQELRLPLDNLLRAEVNGTEPFYYFDGASYTYEEAVDDLKAIWQTLHRDLIDAGYPTLYHQSTRRAQQLDQMSIIDWINQSIPGGIASRLGQLLDVAYNIEYGAECDRQSALNLLYLLGYNSPGQFSVFGQSDEKFHVRGGNDRIATTLASQLASPIVGETRLVAVRRNAAGAFTLSFQRGALTFDVTADKAVFGLPFSILRESVDLTQADFSALKMIAIRELAMGTSAKLNVQFSRRHWNTLGSSGDTYSDRGYQNTWEVTRGQPGTAGILVDYTGGNIGNGFNTGTPASRAQQFLEQIEPVLPGLSATWNGRATIDHWPSNPFSLGSYSYWQIGQYTRFAGIEGEQEGNAHFCGEHTSVDAQGYLEGAVESGERAAAEVISDLTR
jgi:monoamine oxidase